ncbi:HNH endonuclease [Nostoc ellipsosporum NOK]|uniref:HNH endonuclease n=1 Tax=Sphingomonas sp. IBVSS2 TaxID=1985172 RepID=UPI000A2ED100|nr:HNH endonuclease signature motif containing protein [Sphingomonas sp. IBVSS2]MDF2383077.1 HNH endonuclease [Nostoc ellipsosporum NOK]OSZ70169.1 hypothetical protein CAP40_04915 [Sphingomonas sp. IBVSS2]
MPRKKITPEDTAEAYAVAKRVIFGELAEAEGVAELVTTRDMNPASASDQIRNLRQMLTGKAFHRTLSAYSIRYYLEHIEVDFGASAMATALRSVRAHIEYYNALGNGRLNRIETVCNEIESRQTGPRFEDLIRESEALPNEERRKRLTQAQKQPQVYVVKTIAFRRNPDVVAEVLARANGRCERCGNPAPFSRKSDGSPYLEVHHKETLASGGDDTVANAIALCPNCHRRMHFGE